VKFISDKERFERGVNEWDSGRYIRGSKVGHEQYINKFLNNQVSSW